MYEIEFKESVEKDLAKITDSIRNRILTKVVTLKENPRPKNCRKLKGTNNAYRIRVGDYRVIYEIFDRKLLVLVIAAGHRKEIYD